MSIALPLLALLPVAVWLYLLVGRGMFWVMAERDDADNPADPDRWPSVVAVVPARNEADVIAHSIGSLLDQDYPGDFRIVLVDDQSTDDTGAIARKLDTTGKLTVITGSPRPAGWTGKLWAMKQGTAAAGTPDYIWFTDADVRHEPNNLRKLMARAAQGNLTLTSLMVKLHCKSMSEAYLIPAFVFFFDMLYPFRWVNDPRNRTAAAAGGCMLVKREALERAGGIDAIRREIIDDCALGRAMKAQGPIWLGLTDRAASVRPYRGVAEIRAMVARSAYAQLGYSPLMLLGTFLGMVAVYAAAPVLAIFARESAQASGVLAWLAMAHRVPADPALLSRLAALGHRAAADRLRLRPVHARLRDPALARPRRHVEGQGAGPGPIMSQAADLASGKGHTDENFPVASVLIAREHRPTVMAFYRFARAADDVADHPTAAPEQKLALLEAMRASLTGESDASPEGVGAAQGAGRARPHQPARPRPARSLPP